MTTFNLSILVKVVDRAASPLRGLARLAGGVSRGFGAIGRALGRVVGGPGLDRLTRSATAAAAAVKGVGGALGQIAAQGAVAGAAVAGLFYGFKRTFFDTAADFETLGVMLKTVEGTAEGAQRATTWITDFAQRTPLELDGVTSAYIKLKNFGIDPTQGALETLVNQNAKMGGGSAELEGLILAVGQAWTKQKLQGEEALQLIERGVPVWEMLAKAMGKSTPEIMKLSEQGRLGRKEIKLLMEQIALSAAGAADDQSHTARGILSNLSDYWTKFVNLVMKVGAFDWIKGRLQRLLDLIQTMEADGRLLAWAKRIGAALVDAFGAIERFLFGYERAIGGDGGELEHVAGLVEQLGDAFQTAAEWVTPFIERFGAGRIVLAAVAAVIGGPLIAALATLAAALFALGAAALAAFGWIVIPIAAIAGLAWLIIRNWDSIASFFEGLWGDIVAAFRGALQWLADSLAPAFNAIASTIRAAWDGMAAWFSSLWDGIIGRFRSAVDQVKAIWSEVSGFFGTVADFVGGGNGPVMSEGETAQLINDGQRAREALNGPDYIPGERPGAAAARKLLGAGRPVTGAAAALGAQGAPTGAQRVETKTEVVITGRNLPPGITVQPGRSSADDTRLDLGYSMVTP